MTLYSAKTWVGISSYSFLIFFPTNRKAKCIYHNSAKHIIDIRGMSVFECPDDSLDLSLYKQI